LKSLIDEINPSVIVHRYIKLIEVVNGSAAEKSHDTTSDPSKKDQVERLNVQVPEFFGKITRERGILLIYISTGRNRFRLKLIVDYVFDGKNPPYYPDSPTKFVFF